MCPDNTRTGLLNISINESWTDAELVEFLSERKEEDFLPENVVVGLNFFLIDPRDSPGNIWCLNCSYEEEHIDCLKNTIRKAKQGYWKYANSVKVPTGTDIIGVKVTFDHYESQGTSVKRTGWVMSEYQVKNKASIPQEYHKLSTMFFQRDRKLGAKDKQKCMNEDAPNKCKESYLQYLVELEEKKSSLNPQRVTADEQTISWYKEQGGPKTTSPGGRPANSAIGSRLLHSKASIATVQHSKAAGPRRETIRPSALLIQKGSPRNTVSVSLDGNPDEVRESYYNSIGSFREWCQAGGIRVDVSDLYGENSEVYTTREDDTFYYVFKYGERWLSFAISGRKLWLEGFQGQNGTYQFPGDDPTVSYMLQRNCKFLNFSPNYIDISPGGVENTKLGYYQLRNAFDSLWSYKGVNPEPQNMRESFGRIVTYICEAARYQFVFETILSSFVDESINRLNSSSYFSFERKIVKRSEISDWIHNWSKLSGVAMEYINSLKTGEEPPVLNNHGIDSISSAENILSEIRILERDAYNSGVFEHEDAPRGPQFAAPVDGGEGDPEIKITLDQYHVPQRSNKRHLLKQQKSHFETKGRNKRVKVELDNPIQISAAQKFYMGGGLGGPSSPFPPSLVQRWTPVLVPKIHNTSSSFAVHADKGEKGVQLMQGEIARDLVKNNVPCSPRECANLPFLGGQKRNYCNWLSLSPKENFLIPLPRVGVPASILPGIQGQISNSTCSPFDRSAISSRNARACLVYRYSQLYYGYRAPVTSSSPVLQSISNSISHNTSSSFAVHADKGEKGVQLMQGEIARDLVKNNVPSSPRECANPPFLGGQKRSYCNWLSLSPKENFLIPFPRVGVPASILPGIQGQISNSTCSPFDRSAISSRNARACLVHRYSQLYYGYRAPVTSSSPVLQSISNSISPNFVMDNIHFFWHQQEPLSHRYRLRANRLVSLLLRLLH